MAFSSFTRSFHCRAGGSANSGAGPRKPTAASRRRKRRSSPCKPKKCRQECKKSCPAVKIALFMEGWPTKSSSLTWCSGTSSSACPSANSYASQVFTNGDRMHASRALMRLGIEDCFEGVMCFETLNPTSPIPVSVDE